MIEVTPTANDHLSDIVSSSKEEYEAIALTKGTLYIDPLAVMYVLGSVVDYSKDVFGAILKVENPNVQSQCGCGESFSV